MQVSALTFLHSVELNLESQFISLVFVCMYEYLPAALVYMFIMDFLNQQYFFEYVHVYMYIYLLFEGLLM